MTSASSMRLQIVALILLASGAVLAAGAAPAIAAPARLMLDAMIWPVDGDTASLNDPATRLAMGVAGGLMVGWATMILLLARGATVARALAFGAGAWFLVDSSASIAAGAASNAAFNVGFLALIAFALWPQRRRTEGGAGEGSP